MDDYIPLESGAPGEETLADFQDAQPTTSHVPTSSYPSYTTTINDAKAEEIFSGGNPFEPEPTTEPISTSIHHVSTITVIVSIGILLIMTLFGWIVYRVRVRPMRQGGRARGCLGARHNSCRRGPRDVEKNIPRDGYLEPSKRPSLDRRESAATTSTLVSTSSVARKDSKRAPSLYLHQSQQNSSIHLPIEPNAAQSAKTSDDPGTGDTSLSSTEARSGHLDSPMSGTTSPSIQESGEGNDSLEPMAIDDTNLSLAYVPFGPLSTVSEAALEEEEEVKKEEPSREEEKLSLEEEGESKELGIDEEGEPPELHEYEYMVPFWTPSSRLSLLIGNYLKTTGSPQRKAKSEEGV
ncbi:hypothetical protein CPB86DRAFT_779629 [Serendipita vermifera]|nr:hypothetical protein CPB86DRAFT_779629 [Serendipita vermifera]